MSLGFALAVAHSHPGVNENNRGIGRNAADPLVSLLLRNERGIPSGRQTVLIGPMLDKNGSAEQGQGAARDAVGSGALDLVRGLGCFGPFLREGDQLVRNWWGASAWEELDWQSLEVVKWGSVVSFLGKPHDMPILLMIGFWDPQTPFAALRRHSDPYNLVAMTR